MMKNLYPMLFYSLSIVIFFNYSSPFIFWIMMELNLLSFIYLMFNFNFHSKIKQELSNCYLFYFLIQSFASILFLSNYFFSMELAMFNFQFLFFISLILKIGLFPFHFWVLKIVFYLDYFSVFLLLTLQKIPIFFIFFNSFNYVTVYFLIFSFIFGSFMVFFSDHFLIMLVSSSISSSIWLYFLFVANLFLFLIYFFFYIIFIFNLFKIYNYGAFFKFGGFTISFFILNYLFLIGLPPLSSFFFKLFVVDFLFLNFGVLEICLFFFFMFLSLFGYIKFFYINFFFFNSLYKYNDFGFLKMFFFYFSMGFFFFFLFC